MTAGGDGDGRRDLCGRGPRAVGWVMLGLMMVLLFVPFGAAFIKSFQALDLALPEQTGSFVGSANYRTLLVEEPEFYSSLRATGITLAASLAQCLIAFSLALWLERLWPRRLPRLLSVLLVFPMLLSQTVVALMGRLYLNDQVGLAAKLLAATGLSTQPPLASERGAFFWICALDAWQWIPFSALLFWLCFQAVPQRELEAAQVDGLTWAAVLRSVILPRIPASLVAIVLIRLLATVSLFDIPDVLTGGGPGTATLTVSMYASRVTFEHQRFGVAAAHMVAIYAAVAVLMVPLIRQAAKLRAMLKGQAR